MTRWGLVSGLGALALVGLGLSQTAEATQVVSPGEASEAIAAVRGLAAEAGLPAEWGDFFALVAQGESGGNPQARNVKPSEAEAARESYDNNAYRLEHCGHGADAYSFGSGGLFGFLPAVGLTQLGEAFRCLPPSSVFQPRIAIAMAVGFARGLMRWERYDKAPTWLNLRAMWGAPSKGGDPAFLNAARPEFEKDAANVGLRATWLDESPPPLSPKAADVLRRLNPDLKGVSI